MNFFSVKVIDYHTAGEPFRIVPQPPVDLSGDRVSDRRRHALTDPDATFLRDFVVLEPRGHRDMFGGFVVPPDDKGADLGVVFFDQHGYTTACGHGTIALGTWAVQAGLVAEDPSGTTDVTIDVPSGRVTARVHTTRGVVTHVDFVNVASFPIVLDHPLVTSRGGTKVHVAYGGALYAHVDASSIGLSVETAHLVELVAAGREIRQRIQNSGLAVYPSDSPTTELCGVIFYDRLGTDLEGRLVHRNVVVYGDGQVDRSPCGSGTSSRMAVLHAMGELAEGRSLVHRSIVGTEFVGKIASTCHAEGRAAIKPIITGSAHRIGSGVFEIDPSDALVPGFRL